MSAPDRIWIDPHGKGPNWPTKPVWLAVEFIRADGPTITAWKTALRDSGLNPDSIAREAQKEAQNG